MADQRIYDGIADGYFRDRNASFAVERADGVVTAIASQPLADAARVLADFAKTAPGRLPQRVQDALGVVDRVRGVEGSKS